MLISCLLKAKVCVGCGEENTDLDPAEGVGLRRRHTARPEDFELMRKGWRDDDESVGDKVPLYLCTHLGLE